MGSVDLEVSGINMVAFDDLFEYFWLVDSALLHEVDDLVVDIDTLVHVVLKLNLYFILELAFLGKEFSLIRISILHVVLSEEVHLGDGGPRHIPVTDGSLRRHLQVLASPQEMHLMDPLIKSFDVHHMRNPSKAMCHVKHREGYLPLPQEGVDEVDVPSDWDETVVHDVWVLQIHDVVLDVVASEKKHFSISVEGTCLAGFVHIVCPLKVLRSSLIQFLLCSIVDLMQVVHLAEVTSIHMSESRSIVAPER